MLFVAYVIGVFRSIITAFFVIFLNDLTGTELHSRTMLFVIPMGAIIFGMSGAVGLFIGKRITQIKIVKWDYIVAIVLGLFTFLTIHYISYISSGFSSPIDVVTTQQSISYSSTDRFTHFGGFVDYLIQKNQSSTMNVFVKGSSGSNTLYLGEMGTTIFFLIQILGFVIGSASVRKFFKDMLYCASCKRYYKRKLLKSCKRDGIEGVMKDIRPEYDLPTIHTIIESIVTKSNNASQYVDLELFYCPNCFQGGIVARYFVVGSDSLPHEVNDMQQKLFLSQDVIKGLV